MSVIAGIVISVAIGFVAGITTARIFIDPKKHYEKGFKDAQKIFSNWGEGFREGWNTAIVEITKGWKIKGEIKAEKNPKIQKDRREA